MFLLQIHRHQHHIWQEKHPHYKWKHQNSRFRTQLDFKISHQSVFECLQKILKQRSHIVPNNDSNEEKLDELQKKGVEELFSVFFWDKVINVSFDVVGCICVICEHTSQSCENFYQAKNGQNQSKKVSNFPKLRIILALSLLLLILFLHIVKVVNLYLFQGFDFKLTSLDLLVILWLTPNKSWKEIHRCIYLLVLLVFCQIFSQHLFLFSNRPQYIWQILYLFLIINSSECKFLICFHKWVDKYLKPSVYTSKSLNYSRY